MVDEKKEPMVQNGIVLKLDEPMQDFDGTSIKQEGDGKIWKTKTCLLTVLRLHQPENDAEVGTTFALGVKVAMANGTVELDQTNLEVLKNVLRKSKLSTVAKGYLYKLVGM